jgi:hypothetical protein
MLFDCLRGVGWLRIAEQSLEPNLIAVCKKRSKLLQPSETTTQPRAAALRALINKQHGHASRVVAVLSFDQNVP